MKGDTGRGKGLRRLTVICKVNLTHNMSQRAASLALMRMRMVATLHVAFMGDQPSERLYSDKRGSCSGCGDAPG